MLTAVTVLCFVLAGYEISVRCWRGQASALETWCATLVIGSALWISSVWLAALSNQLDRRTMLLRTAAVGTAAVVAWVLRRGGSQFLRPIPRSAVLLYVIPSIPVVAWVFFVLWRATVVPPLSHDALAYHLPRAVFFTRLHRFDHLDWAADARLRTLPANYEMLISDVLLLDGDDSITEWIAVFFYVSFVLACGALVQRWWRTSFVPPFAVMLLVASVPVLLLHSGADKNDTMGAFFMVAALVFGGRWIAGGDRPSLFVAAVAFAAGIGTKGHTGVLAVCMIPFLLWRFMVEVRGGRLSRRWIAAFVLLCLAAVFLLGGVAYLANLRHGRELIDVRVRSDAGEGWGLVPYSDWANLWQAPWVIITAPFSPRTDDLYVPWEKEPWFWKRYEIYFSHLGIPFALCAVLLPFAIARYRNDDGDALRERAIISLVAGVALLLLLPVRFIPHGMFLISLPRYAMFIVPIVFAWTVAPAVQRLASRNPWYLLLFFYVASLWFVRQAVDNAINDRFVPWTYVEWAAAHPGTRVIPFDPGRAASIADQFARQDEKIAVDGGFGAWLQPLFGASLKRPVEFIPPGSGPPQIPDDAKWVVIDQGWHVIWEQAAFTDLSQAWRYISQGQPSSEEMRVFRYLAKDPRFELIYRGSRNQAVFWRR